MKFYIALLLTLSSTNCFVPSMPKRQCIDASRSMQSSYHLYRPKQVCMSSTEAKTESSSSDISLTEQQQQTEVSEFPPILEELRDVAMKLHTREQSPREGKAEAPAKPDKPYVPTHGDYLQFLVDSKAVYDVLEDIVNSNEKLEAFRNTGIERTQELEKDIEWMCNKYDLQRPDVGIAGKRYAAELNDMVKSDDDIPEFMCHYYNYYFAHLAGGRMIGKQMSKLLLDGVTLEFYKVSNIDCQTTVLLLSSILRY